MHVHIYIKLNIYVPNLEGSSCPCDTRVSQIHTKLWGKQLPASGGKNKPSLEKMVIQGKLGQMYCLDL